MRYLTEKELKYTNQYAVQMVGGTNYGVQSQSALEVVINHPQQVVLGQELYPNIWLKAAFILQKITKKHVFVDGNKRTSIQAAMYFLKLNGYVAADNNYINTVGEEVVMMVTNSADSEDVMIWLADWLEKAMVKV